MKILSLTFYFTWIAFLNNIIFTKSSFAVNKITKRYTHYTDVGNGFPIILIPPCPTEAVIYKSNQEGLKNKFRVIAIDLYGFGFSSQKNVTGQPITPAQYAEQVKDVLDHLEIDKAIIGGESHGGMVAMAFLDLYPDMVAGLILTNTEGAAESEHGINKFKGWIKTLMGPNGLYEWMSWFLPNAFIKPVDPITQEFFENIAWRTHPIGLASAINGMIYRPDYLPTLSRTDSRILIITGQFDTIIPLNASYLMLNHTRNGVLESIEGAGHFASLEKPNEWNNLVIKYFDNLNYVNLSQFKESINLSSLNKKENIEKSNIIEDEKVSEKVKYKFLKNLYQQ